MHECDLKEQARLIFAEALSKVDAGAAIRRAIKFSGNSQLSIVDEVYQLTERTPIYAVAVGKAAYPMALAVDDILDDKLNGGIASGILPEDSSIENLTENKRPLSLKWRVFAGGHPLPNEASLAAAQSCFELLKKANHKKAIIIFLISGGGSAMLESPLDDSITLTDLRQTNNILISCGASITEVNIIRRVISRVKGGGLAALAPLARQITLIISDTETGDEKSVASGLTFAGEKVDSDEINTIVKRYRLTTKLPPSVLYSLTQKPLKKPEQHLKNIRRHYVLLDNQIAVNAAADCARNLNFVVEVAGDISQQNVKTGCAELVNRMNKARKEISENKVACLISGGEFSCPVRGRGKGGRNSETALRMALMLDKNRSANSAEVAFLSAGTDGIDGNSCAAGAVCNYNTINRADSLQLDARSYLENSDSFTFFQALGDLITTRPTGTNVRDLRIMLARK